MAAPKDEIMQMEYQNPHASAPLFLPVLVMCNTPNEEIRHNVTTNSALDLEWLKVEPEHDGVAVMIGGGGSVADYIAEIKDLQHHGGVVFAMNAASKWAREHGVDVDYQCIIDAKEETSTLVDPEARGHLFGSQCHPKTVDAVLWPIIWHVESGSIEDYFPPEKVARGGYALLGGGAGVGNSAVVAAYALGFREFHIFGFDSSHRDGKSHAYEQPMNTFIPNTQVRWGDRTFTASVAMKVHAERFQVTSQKLKQLGCNFTLYGDGLLQTMYHTKPENLRERDKYQTLWQFDAYRAHSPGLRCVPAFLEQCRPTQGDIVIDYGCGSGKASVELARLGHDVFLVDFTDNCRDAEAVGLPFLEWDLSRALPVSSPFGFCCDVMEHMPPEQVPVVLGNIMAASDEVFFQISTIPDSMGELIDHELHLTVMPHEWWRSALDFFGDIAWEDEGEIASMFHVKRRNTDG